MVSLKSFEDGISITQKVLVLLFVVLLSNTVAYIFLLANFVPKPEVILSGAYATAAYLAINALAITWLRKSGIWKFRREEGLRWNAQRFLSAFAGAPLIFIVVWVSFSWAIPSYITRFSGTEGAVVVQAERRQRYGRFSFCHNQVKLLPWWERAFFRWCISERQFSDLPEGVFNVEFEGVKSSFGLLPYRMQLAQ